MDTTLTNSYSVSVMLLNDATKSTITEKEQPPQNQGLSSVVLPALLAGLLINPIHDIPTNAVPDYSIYSHYAQTGQLNEIEFEKSIVDTINSYKRYPANWDGYDGIPPSSGTIENALAFLEKLPFGTTEPRPGLSGDGEISLFWEYENIFVDIGLLGNGKYTLYARDDQEIEYFKDDIDLKDPLPDALLNLIYIR